MTPTGLVPGWSGRVRQVLGEVFGLLIGPLVAVALALLVGAIGIILFSGLLPAGKPLDV